jgi:RimJ/RimL family protein N-acetyltransferase
MSQTIPQELIMETDKVLLRPTVESDFEAFHLLAQDKEMWNYFTLNMADETHLKKWMDLAFFDRSSGSRRPFTIIDKMTNRVAGSSSMGNISYGDLRLEIGWSWLGKEFRSTGLNRNAKYAMMRYAFEHLGFERVEFKTDVLNARARKGLENVGGKAEGILRSHMTMWNNRRRTSIYYSVLKNEWTDLKETTFKDITGYDFH